MRKATGGRLGLVLAAGLCFCSLAAAAQSHGAGAAPVMGDREKAAKAAENLKSPIPERQVEAMRLITQIQDPQVQAEFKFIDELVAVAQDEKANPRIRYEALRTLLVLQNLGISSPKLLTFLAALVTDKAADLRVKMQALYLLGQLAGPASDMSARSACDTLKKLLRQHDLPEVLSARVYAAIGNFSEHAGVKEAVLAGLKEKSSVVRAGALAGLRKVVENTGKTDDRLQRELMQLLQRGEGTERIEAIKLLATLVRNGADLGKAAVTKETLLKLVNEGSDQEVCTAAELLLSIADADVVKQTAKALTSRVSKLQFATLLNLVQVLGGMLAQTAKWSDRAAAKDAAEDITKVLYWLIDPKTDPKPPLALRKSAIFGLGMTPTEYDRRPVVKNLLAVLAVEAKGGTNELVEELEKSLQNLTGEDPKRFPDPATNEERPDIEGWSQWLEQNQDQLDAGKTPWQQ